MTAPVSDLQRGGSGTPNGAPGPTLLGILSLLPPQYRWTRKRYFGYTSNFLPLTASLTLQNVVAIAGDSDFIITFAEGIVTDTTDLINLPFVPQLVQLTDQAAGLALFLSPAHFNTVYGDAQNPGLFATPYVMRQATSLAVQHQNLEATNRNVRINFNGFKSWPNTDTRLAKWQ